MKLVFSGGIVLPEAFSLARRTLDSSAGSRLHLISILNPTTLLRE